MKFSFELSKSAPRGVTGASLRRPMDVITPEHMNAYRFAQEFEQKMKRSYDASLTDQYSADFRQTYGSANAEIVTGKYKVRARTRTLAKDTPHGKAIIRTFQNNVVGHDPFKLEMRVGDYNDDGEFTEETKLNRAIEHAWKKFCKKKNFTVRKNMSAMEALRVVEASLVRDGNLLCRHYRDYKFNEFGYGVDFLEEDRLQETYSGRSPMNGKFGSGNPIRESIEFHPLYNFALAYWVLTRHPGEVINPSGPIGPAAPKVWREQVPADDMILFSNLRDRAEQDVGMTELDSTTMPLWRIHQYEKALTLASIASGSKPWWLEQKLPTGFVVPDELKEQFANTPGWGGPLAPGGTADNNPATTQEGVGTPTNVVRPASRETLPPGYELKQADPKFPIEAADKFRDHNVRDIAIGSGVSFQHASGDFQNLGFIAGLMCQIPFQDWCRIRQQNIIDGGVDEIFKNWLRSAILVGYFERKGVEVPISRLDELVEAAHFKGRGWAFVNPLVQAQALIILNEGGHLTRQQVQDQLSDGVSFEKLVQMLKREKEELTTAGLNFDEVDVTRPTISKGEPGQDVPAPQASGPGGPADAPPKSRPANPVRRKIRPDGMTMDALVRMSQNGDNH